MNNSLFDGAYYLNHLDKVLSSISNSSVEGGKAKIKQAAKGVGTFISRNLNYVAGDKHWYDNTIAHQVIQYYLWEAKFDPAKNAQILAICQELEKVKDLPLIDKIQLDLAKKACRPLPDVSEKVLFHIHGDEFGLGSELEGAHLSDLLEYLEKFLTTRKESNLDLYQIDDELLEEIRSAMLLSFAFDAERATEKVQEKRKNMTLTYIRELPLEFLVKAKEKLSKAFETEKPILLPGGWIGKPSGHSMYYEVIPQKGGKRANLRIYNLGAGSNYHQTAVVKGKLKIAPYTEWTGIDKEKFLSDPFLKGMYETRKLSEDQGVSTEYNASDIYQALREFLNPKSILEEKDELKLMTGQRAGTCSYRSLLAFLATRMKREDFKRLTLDIQFHSLINRVNKASAPSQRELRLIKKSHQKLSRKTQKAYHQHIINKNDLKLYTEELSNLKTHVEDLQVHQKASTASSSKFLHDYQQPQETILTSLVGQEKLILDEQVKKGVEKPIPQHEVKYYLQLKELLKNDKRSLQERFDKASEICKEAFAQGAFQASTLAMNLLVQLDELKRVGSQDLNQIKLEVETPIPQPEVKYYLQLKELKNEKIALKERLEKAEKICQEALAHNAYHALELGMVELALSLPSRLDELRKVGGQDLNQMKNAISTLGRISQSFFNNCFWMPESENVHPRRLYVLIKLFWMQMSLAHQVEPKWKVCAYNLPSQDLLFNFCDFRFEKDFHQLKFDSYNDNLQYILNFQYQSDKDEPIGENAALVFEQKKQNYHQTMDAAYLFPELFPDIAKEFSKLAPHEQIAHLYASDQLPDWIKAIRNTHLALIYLKQEPIAKPPSTNAPLNFEFNVQDQRDKSQVWISVNGIDGNLQELYPEIKKMRQNPQDRFAGLYLPFSSSQSKMLFKAMQKYDWSMTYCEKDVVCDQSALYQLNLPDEEFKELMHIITGKTTGKQEALAFFQNHPEKLKDPDYQIFFKIFFLHTNFKSLIDEIKINDTFSDNLATFIENTYKHYRAQNELQTCVFLLQMAHEFSGYSPEKTFYKTTLTELRQLLSKVALEIEEKSLLYAELIAQISRKEELSEEEVKELLIGTVYLRQNPVIPKWLDPLTNMAVRDSVIIHSERILKALKTEKGANQVLLNEILHSIFPSAKEQQWNINQVGDQVEFISLNGRYRYMPLSRQFQEIDQETPLPLQVREHPYFRKFFPTIRQGMTYQGNIYRFTDSKGQETLVKLTENQLIIEQKRDGKWLRFVPSDQMVQKVDDILHSCLISRHLVHHFTHWQDPVDPTQIIMIDPLTHLTAYTAKVEGNQIVEIRREKDGARLGKSSHVLNHFEDDAYVQEWFNDAGKLIEIELPRFDLNFKFDSTHQHFICEQKKGYFLDFTRVETLGVFNHYLSLKNDQDKELVLIPKQEFQAPSKKEVLEPRYKINTQVALENREKQNFFTYEINGKKQIVSPTIESSLYLSQVLTLVQEYDTAAATLLKGGVKLSPYTENERKILEDLIALHEVNGDESGNALAIRSFASYCLVHNSITHQKELSQQTLKLVNVNYHKYLEHFSHATALHLEKAEEIFLLKLLLNQQFDPVLFVRLKQLDPEYAQTLTFKIEENLTPGKKEEEFNPFQGVNLEFNHNNSQPPNKENILVTRPGKIISKRLGYFFPLALQGTEEEKETLRNYLPFLKYESSGKYLGLALFLEIVLNYPQDFSLPPKNIGFLNEDFEEWQKTTLKQAHTHRQDLVFSELKEKDISLPKQEIAENPQIVNKFKQQKMDFALNLTPVPLFAKESEPYFTKAEPEEQQISSAKEMQKIVKLTLSELPKDIEPLEKAEWERIEKDLNDYASQQQVSTYFPKDKNSFQQLSDKINDKKSEIDSLLETKEVDILALANHMPIGKTEQELSKLEIWGKTRKVVTLEDLILCFGRKDLEAILKGNPALTLDEAKLLMSQIGDYLLQATLGQQLERSREILNELLQLSDTESEKLKNLIQKLAAVLPEAQRKYDPAQHPAYLVFEYASDILLFPKQIEILEAFLNGKDKNLVMEMIMGSGKSKVLLPLLGLLRANEKDLSMLIVPQFIFEDVASGTQKILGEAFAQKMKTLHFDRHTTSDILKLQLILDELLIVKKEQQCLIMTSQSVLCLILKYIEKCEAHFKKEDHTKPFSEELILLRKILNVLSSSGYPILDEADTLLNILHEKSFSIGEGRTPNKDEVQLISELYSLIYFDPDITNLAKTESDPKLNPNTSPLTEQIFFQKCQHLLAEKFLDRFSSIEFETKLIKEKVSSFVSSLTSEQKKLILDYLCRNEKNVKKSQAYYDKLDPDIQNLLALVSEELCHLLPYTLLKNSDEKYGLDEEKGGIIAIPFSAAKTPSRGSQFANAFITINYTFQIYAKKGISREIIEKEIKRLQGQAMKELQKDGHQGLEATDAWKLFALFSKGSKMSLFNYKEQELDALVTSINSESKKKQNFIQRIILPQLVLYDEKLSCNPLNLIAVLNKVIGFTGTLWNSKSMHRKLNPHPAKGTDGKTLSLLQKQSSTPVISVKANTTEELLTELYTKKIKFNLIADSGGYCREWSNERIAKHLAKQWNEPIVYYNKTGQQVETDGEKVILLTESKTPTDKRKTFLDQSRTTGADIPQALDAIGLVTIGENMLLRDLLQSVWRLRGLDKGQRIQFIVTEKVKEMINQELKKKEGEEISYKDILKFTIHNQVKQQAKDNFKTLKKELQSLPQMLLLQVLLHPDIPLEKQRLLYRELRSSWIQSTAQKPKELFGKIAIERDSKLVVEEEGKLCTSHLNSLFDKFPWLEEKGFKKSELLEDVESIIKRMENGLASKLISPQSEDDNTVEIEQELKTETEIEIQMESEFQEEKKQLGFIKKHSFKQVTALNDELFNETSKDLPYFSLKLYFQENPLFKPYANAFDGIELTLNVLQWPKKDSKVKDLQLFGPNRTPFHFVSLQNGHALLLSQIDTDQMFQQIFQAGLYHLKNGILKKKDQSLVTPEMAKKIVKIKFLNGDSHYSKQELDFLREWFKQEGAEKMKTLYHKYILAGFPQKAIHSQGSALDHLFKEVCQ